jgi:methylenetetrahydrofolate/methylenetetrahydromethanopterin dehydrogenase (NADP+)
MKKLLLQLDGDPHPSVFDRIVAHDAGADEVLSYGAVTPDDVTALVHGAIFTRGPKELHRTAVWVGGSRVPVGEKLLEMVVKVFFGPFRVSVMMDANGCNTTAAAAVARLTGVVDLKSARVTILAGTGPVGLRAAVLFAREGAKVTLSSRSRDRAEAASDDLRSRFGVEVAAVEAKDEGAVARALEGAQVCLTAGAAGTTLLPRTLWSPHPTLKALADVNAVPPLGIEGIEASDKGTQRDGKTVFGALGIGGLKMKVHKACVARLFERNDEVLDLDAIYRVARAQ